jgi:hypothetical protein
MVSQKQAMAAGRDKLLSRLREACTRYTLARIMHRW